jgi:phosphohistidine swiveling domain-containing protein
MINPNKELFIWGPIDGMPIYPSVWYGGLIKFAKRFISWPTFYMWSHNEKLTFISDYQKLRDSGEVNFKKFILVDNELDKNYKEWKVTVEDLLKYMEDNAKEKIINLNDKELSLVFEGFLGIYSNFWIVGLLPEICNWGGEQLLRKELKKNITDSKEFSYAVAKLSAPEDYSFYQEEELDLLEIKKHENEKEKMLAEHQKKFFWLLNSYHHTKILPVEHFRKELSKISLKEAEDKLKSIKEMKTNILKEKSELIEKHNLSNDIEKIAHRLAFSIWWQDHRKKYIFMVNHYIDLFLHEISKRQGLDFDELHYYSIEEISELLKSNTPLPKKEMENRKLYSMRNYYEEGNKDLTFSGKEVETMVAPYIKTEVDENLKEFKGITVCIGNGIVKGKVKIVTSAKEINKVNDGDILVTPMTAPDYVVGMKKAIAVITDEGGMTCHAAIVSRELQIPCIVGTKIATKVLKDNDLVEIDAEKGIVKKI